VEFKLSMRAEILDVTELPAQPFQERFDKRLYAVCGKSAVPATKVSQQRCVT